MVTQVSLRPSHEIAQEITTKVEEGLSKLRETVRNNKVFSDGTFLKEIGKNTKLIGGTLWQSFAKPYTGALQSGALASSLNKVKGMPLPGPAKLVGLGLVGVFGLVHSAKALSSGYRTYGTLTSVTPDAAREGVIYNGVEAATSGFAGATILQGLGSKILGFSRTPVGLKLIPYATVAGLVSWSLGNLKSFAKGDHPLAQHRYIGSESVFAKAEDGYLNPLWHSYQSMTAGLDNKILKPLIGFHRTELVGQAPLSPLFHYEKGSIAERMVSTG